jgi:hypothetical protein
MIEERVEVREGDILIIHTGYHHFGWDQPRTRPTRSAPWSSTPAPTASSPSGARPRRSAGSASTAAAPTIPCLHLCALACRQDRQAQVNTIIRNWMPRQATEADKLVREMYGTTIEKHFTDTRTARAGACARGSHPQRAYRTRYSCPVHHSASLVDPKTCASTSAGGGRRLKDVPDAEFGCVGINQRLVARLHLHEPCSRCSCLWPAIPRHWEQFDYSQYSHLLP